MVQSEPALQAYKSKSFRLRTHFSLLLAGIVAALTILLGTVVHQVASDALEEEIGQSLSEVAELVAGSFDRAMWSRAQEVRLLREFGVDQTPENITQLFDGVQQSIPAFAWIGLTDAEGKVIAATSGHLEGETIAHRPVFYEARESHFYGDLHPALLLEELIGRNQDDPLLLLDISYPVFDEQGDFAGVLAAHLDWNFVRSIQDQLIRADFGQGELDLIVTSSNGQQILVGPQNYESLSHLIAVSRAYDGEQGYTIENWPDGNEYFAGYIRTSGYRDFPGFNWVVMVRQPAELAKAPLYDLQRGIWIAGIACVFLFAIIGWFLSGALSLPLSAITRAADEISQGKVAAIPRHQGIYEIESLESSLQGLLTSLTSAESELGAMVDKAHRDALTGLPNRNSLSDYLKKAMQQAEFRHETLTFLYIDLDRFKPVNDIYGHKTGDYILQETAIRLQQQVRAHELAVRLGGDEFLLIIKTDEQCPQQAGRAVAERVIESMSRPFQIRDKELVIGCTLGGAVWPFDAANPQEVIDLADKALYRAKQAGKNRVLFHQESKDQGN